VDEDAQTPPVMLLFDDEVPAGASLQNSHEWISAAEADDLELDIEMGLDVVVPLSGIRGYSLTADGSTPDELIEVGATQDSFRFPRVIRSPRFLRAQMKCEYARFQTPG